MAVKIQLRRDLASNWGSSTVLASGEVGYETDTGNIKIGDGTTQWSALAYYQFPNVSVDPAISGNTDLNDADYRVMGRYRLNSVTGGSTFTNVPSDFAATVDADSVSTLIVTSHAYPSVSPTMIQQLLTQFSASATDLKQWVRLYNGTNYTAWTSTAHLSDSEVTTAKIADSAVTTAKIADANVTTAKILDANVTTAKILDANVTTAKIADTNVTTAKIADSAVTTAKIADSSNTTTGVTNAKIRQSGALSVIGRTANSTGAPADISATAASGAVLRESGSTIGFGTIATAGIADSAVTTAKIAANAVTTAKVATDVVTLANTQVGCVGIVTYTISNAGTLSIIYQYPASTFVVQTGAGDNKIGSTVGTWNGVCLSVLTNGSNNEGGSGQLTCATTYAASSVAFFGISSSPSTGKAIAVLFRTA